MNEAAKINQAIDAFASRIKVRMMEKYNAGYKGWGGEYPETVLIKELIDDAKDIRRNIPIKKFPTTCTNVLKRRLVDIGARSMMLWFRHNQPLNSERKKNK